MTADGSIGTRRVRLLVQQVAAEEGSVRRAAKRLGISDSMAHKLAAGRRSLSVELLDQIRERLGIRASFFTQGAETEPHYTAFLDEPTVELDHDDTAAWLQLEEGGRLDHYRGRGVSEEQIQHVRRAYWDGVPDARDYERLLEAYLLGPGSRREPDAAREARERVEARGGPKLRDVLK